MLLFLASSAINTFADDTRGELFTRSQPKATVVEKVLSADKLRLNTGEVIRLIGIKAPPPPPRRVRERDENGFFIEKADPVTSIEEQAFQFAQNLLEGKTVILEYDLERTDVDSYTLAYVFLPPENILANAEILRAGYAVLHISLPNVKYADRLRAAYREARNEKRGLQGD